MVIPSSTGRCSDNNYQRHTAVGEIGSVTFGVHGILPNTKDARTDSCCLHHSWAKTFVNDDGESPAPCWKWDGVFSILGGGRVRSWLRTWIGEKAAKKQGRVRMEHGAGYR